MFRYNPVYYKKETDNPPKANTLVHLGPSIPFNIWFSTILDLYCFYFITKFTAIFFAASFFATTDTECIVKTACGILAKFVIFFAILSTMFEVAKVSVTATNKALLNIQKWPDYKFY